MKPSGLVVLLSTFVLVSCGSSAPEDEATPRGTSVPASDANAASAISQTEADIRALDEMLAGAWVARDQAVLERFWSPEFVLNAPSNQILTRDEVFREMRTPRLQAGMVSMERTVERVTPFGDIVISMGLDHPVEKEGPFAGIVRTQRYTHVWRREGDTWRVIARHANLLPLADQPSASTNPSR
jgi:ketosteroid isomerase-like protein